MPSRQVMPMPVDQSNEQKRAVALVARIVDPFANWDRKSGDDKAYFYARKEARKKARAIVSALKGEAI